MLRNFIFLFLSLPIVSLWHRLFGWLFHYLFLGVYAFLHQDGFWQRFLRGLVFNLLIGLVVAGLLMFFQHYPLLMDEEDASYLAMQIMPPFGGDDLVAVLCEKPAIGLHTLLAKSQPKIPTPEQIIKQLRGNRCQVGQYAFFSGE